MRLRYCKIGIRRGWGGLSGINRRLRNEGYKKGDEVYYEKLEEDPAVKYVLKYGHWEVYPLKKFYDRY